MWDLRIARSGFPSAIIPVLLAYSVQHVTFTFRQGRYLVTWKVVLCCVVYGHCLSRSWSLVRNFLGLVLKSFGLQTGILFPFLCYAARPRNGHRGQSWGLCFFFSTSRREINPKLSHIFVHPKRCAAGPWGKTELSFMGRLTSEPERLFLIRFASFLVQHRISTTPTTFIPPVLSHCHVPNKKQDPGIWLLSTTAQTNFLS